MTQLLNNVPFLTGDIFYDGRPIWGIVVPFTQGPQGTPTNPATIFVPHNALAVSTSDPQNFVIVDAPRVAANTPHLPNGTGFYSKRGWPYVIQDPTNTASQTEVSVSTVDIAIKSGSDLSGWSGFVRFEFVV